MVKITKTQPNNWVIETKRWIVRGDTLLEAIKEFIMFVLVERHKLK